MPISGAYQTDVRKHLITRPAANFMGLDLSLTGTGMCLLTGDGMVDTFNIGTDKKAGSHTARIAFIRDQIVLKRDAFCTAEDKPKLIAIEGYAMGIRGGMSFTLGELGGVVKEQFRKEGAEVLIVPPHNLKKFIGATGPGKDSVKLEVYKKYGAEFPTSDETDAFVLSVMALSWYAKNVDGTAIPKYQEEALAKCERISFSRTREKL